MRELSSYQFSKVYDDLGIDISQLGSVVLECPPIPVTAAIPKSKKKILRELYFSKSPRHHWVKGAVGETGAHVTVMYGLLSKQYQSYIEQVLADWEPPLFVEVEDIGCFDSVAEGEPYSCIVAHITPTPELLEARARLAFLPHVNTFPEYHPHVTLAYVRARYRDEWITALQQNLPSILSVVGIDYEHRGLA